MGAVVAQRKAFLNTESMHSHHADKLAKAKILRQQRETSPPMNTGDTMLQRVVPPNAPLTIRIFRALSVSSTNRNRRM
jgi:hypothetical protein